MQTYALSRNRLMSRVFLGLCMSLVTATAGVYVGSYLPPAVILLLLLVEVGMCFAAVWIQRRRAVGMPFVLLFTFVSGATIWPTIDWYLVQMGPIPIARALAVSAAAFLISAAVASRASFDFSFLGGFLFVGLLAVVLLGLVSLFLPFASTVSLIYSVLGIAVFIGYVLFDVNRLVHFGLSEEMVPWVVLSLYLDFVNLFLFVLRLMGILESDDR
ncbi:Bax inhibitor-1 family protein [Alicyclobacillus sp.]|uniref:Bax inhibitor-1/YccA family protein n=1 Tax=Alicyclobacillus sp. TaxID=61169 RepID=UPI0025C5F9FF|nr:Bax inhibitor-1 family protein [Alicyclobacillus sp.]MCL6516842.1 Bax inhibitor-1 family protein [Alicyclobacillus sp.]